MLGNNSNDDKSEEELLRNSNDDKSEEELLRNPSRRESVLDFS